MTIYDLFVTIEERRGHQLYAKCPLHPDTNASFTINEDTNEWYCHGCARGGAEVGFLEAYYGVSNKVATYAYEYWLKRGILPFPTEEYINKCVSNLLERPREIQVLHSFGISDASIEKYRIGWDDCRITFPIKSQTGQVVNVRKYLPPHRRIEGSNNQKVLNIKGLGENHFYPLEAFDAPVEDLIILVEGEKDCIAARSQGYNAVTGLAGTTVPMTEIGLFRDRDVIIMTDTDGPGRKFAKLYEQSLRTIAARIRHVQLPVKDFADFYAQCPGQDIMDFIITDGPQEVAPPAEKTILSRSECVEKLNSWMVLDNMSVIGADPKTYTIPIKLRPVCRDSQCTKPCPASSGSITLDVDVDARHMLQFIDSADISQDKYLQKMFGCRSIVAEPVEYINIQKLLFQESASFVEGLDDASFENRFGIFMYEEQRLIPTQKYAFECCRVADPRTQQNYYVIKQATPMQMQAPSNESDFLDYFKQVDSVSDGILDLINNHYKAWMPSLSIEGRADLFGAIILTYLSVTEINWHKGKLKGWLDSIVIGDTRTGKSQMAQRFVKKIQLGGYINGENARATGVIGGVQRMGDSWVITWGAIPMNDRGLLIVDEASGLTVEDLKEFSSTRSSGAVTINKIAKGEARARTRLLWMSNPRSGRNLEDFYWRGYGAFTEFIPVVEDQARFDLVLTAAREDVATLSGIPDNPVDPPFDKWRSLINFAWTVSADNIVIASDVEDTVTALSQDLDNQYGGGPLVVGVAVHEKLLRIGCAIANLCGSIVDGRLVVTAKHIKYASDFMQMTYIKPTLDYRGYITEYKRAQRAKNENTQFIRGLCGLYPALKVLLSSNVFRGMQVKEVLGIDAIEASKIISDLLKRGLLKVTGSGAYAPDKLLIEIAKQMEV